jgi:thermitase
MTTFKRRLTLTAGWVLLSACGGGDGEDAGVSIPAAATAMQPLAVPASATAPDSAVPGELVVKLLAAAGLQPLLAQYRLTVIGQFGTRPIYRVRAAAGTSVQTLAARLARDPRVQFAEPNWRNRTPEGRRNEVWAIGADGASHAGQWSTRALRLAEAHGLSLGAGVTVAVLDTGVDAAHPALAGRLVPGFDFVDFDSDPAERGRVGDKGFGHGTLVASLVAQVAPQARIMPLRVLDAQGAGNVWVLAEALLHAVDPDRNPHTDDGARVINLSLGTTRQTALLANIVEIVSCGDDYDDDDDDSDPDVTRCSNGGGAVVVSAAGNSADTTLHYPAAEKHDGAMAVAASAESGTLASFSTHGDWVHVAAPGDRIHGAIPGGGWGVWSGTSMAAPMVAGAAALLRSRYPEWKPSDVTGKLQSNGRQLCGSNLKQVDVAAALDGTSGPSIGCP